MHTKGEIHIKWTISYEWKLFLHLKNLRMVWLCEKVRLFCKATFSSDCDHMLWPCLHKENHIFIPWKLFIRWSFLASSCTHTLLLFARTNQSIKLSWFFYIEFVPAIVFHLFCIWTQSARVKCWRYVQKSEFFKFRQFCIQNLNFKLPPK